MATQNAADLPVLSTDGQTFIGSTGAQASAAEITGGTNITSTGGSNTTTLALSVSPGLIQISSTTASASSSLDFSDLLDGTYDAYIIVTDSLVPATDNVDLYLRFGTGATPTWLSGATDYFWSGLAGVTHTRDEDAADNQIVINFDNDATGQLGSGSGEGVYSSWTLISNTQTALRAAARTIGVFVDEGGATQQPFGGGGLDSITTAVTSVRLLMSSGNIASGTAILYGVSTS